MGKLYNRQEQTQRRGELRNDQTKAEWLLWLELRSKQLGHKFRRQFGVGPYIIDFYCPELHLGIEVDGDSHFTPEAEAYDEERLRYLIDKGVHLLRFTNDHVYSDLESLLEVIKEQFPKSDLPQLLLGKEG